MQMKITQMLSTRKKKKKKKEDLYIKSIWGYLFLYKDAKSFQNPSLLGNATRLSTSMFAVGRVLTIQYHL